MEHVVYEDGAEKVGSWYSNPSLGLAPQAYGTVVGKYMKNVSTRKETVEPHVADEDADHVPNSLEKVENRNGVQFKDFSSW